MILRNFVFNRIPWSFTEFRNFIPTGLESYVKFRWTIALRDLLPIVHSTFLKIICIYKNLALLMAKLYIYLQLN